MDNNPDRLLVAASKDLPDAIRTLVLEQKVDPSHANGVGQSALHIACLWGHVSSVQALVELGANVHAENSMTGASPLHMVAQSRKAKLTATKDDVQARVRIVEILVNAGARKDQLDKLGNLPVDSATLLNEEYKPLREALEPHAPEVMQILSDLNANALHELLSKTSDMASIEYKGETPVTIMVGRILAAVEGNSDEVGDCMECLRVLSSFNARTDAIASTDEMHTKESPLHRLVSAVREAKSQGKDDSALCTAIELLQNSGALLDNDAMLLLHQAARRNEVAFARYCIESLKMDPNTKGRQGMSPLQFAARSGQLEMAEFLLSRSGIDPTITDDRGQTALQAARVNNRDEVVEVLEKHLKQMQ